MEKTLKKILHPERMLLLLLFAFCIVSTVVIIRSTYRVTYEPEYHLTFLADRFAHKSLSFSPINLPVNDYVDYFSTMYSYFGPFPSIMFIPFVVAFGRDFPQITLGIVSLVISLGAVFFLTKHFRFTSYDRVWLSLFFVFSTVLFGVSIINLSSYQIQAFGTALVLLALAEYFGKKRILLIAVLLACAGMTRFVLYGVVVFFIMEFLQKRIQKKELLLLFIPIIISLSILGAYNYRRFHSISETGYKYNVALTRYPMSSNVKAGFVSVEHIPANIYNLLLRGPDPVLKEGGGFIMQFPYLKVDGWGLAIWFTSPLFLYLLLSFKRGKYTLSSAITGVFLIIPSLLYFGIGYSQFGYRYALDFLPFLLLLLLPSLQPALSVRAKVLIVLGILFNCLYMTSIWEKYPLFGI